MHFFIIEDLQNWIRGGPDMGIAYLTAALRQQKAKVSLLSATDVLKHFLKDRELLKIATSNEPDEKTNPVKVACLLKKVQELQKTADLENFIQQRVEAENPDIVGFSLGHSMENPDIIKHIKGVLPKLEILTLAGGASMNSEEQREFALKQLGFKHVVYGEIGNNIGEFFEKMPQEFRGKPVENLDELPLPDFSLYDLDSFFTPSRALPMLTSRGCPWRKCEFCAHHSGYDRYREHSVEYIERMTEHYKNEYKCKYLMLHDESLMPARGLELANAFEGQGVYVYSYAYPRGFTRPILKKMYDSGFRVLVWGVESGCQRVLDLMNKGTKVNEISQILKDSYDERITNVCFVFFGFPGETKEEALKTVDFLEQNKEYIERHSVGKYIHLPGTPIWERGVKVNPKEAAQRYEEISAHVKQNNIQTCKPRFPLIPGSSSMREFLLYQTIQQQTT